METALRFFTHLAIIVGLTAAGARAQTPYTYQYSNPTGAAFSTSHSLFDGQFLGTRFTLHDRLSISGIDATVSFGNDRNLFAAIVALADDSSFPTGSASNGLSESGEVVYSTLFNPGNINTPTPISIPASVVLDAGELCRCFRCRAFWITRGSLQ